jgi:hypothetical protein
MDAPPSSAAVHAKPAVDVRPFDPLVGPVQQEIQNVSSGVADDDGRRPARQHRRLRERLGKANHASLVPRHHLTKVRVVGCS